MVEMQINVVQGGCFFDVRLLKTELLPVTIEHIPTLAKFESW